MPVTESRRWRVIDSAVWPFKASSEAWCASAGELASEGGGREQAQADVVSTRLITGDQPSLCWGTSGLPPSQRARAQAEWLFKFKFKLARPELRRVTSDLIAHCASVLLVQKADAHPSKCSGNLAQGLSQTVGRSSGLRRD
eukprot:2316452-Rhodomonas_salina.1